MHIYPCELFEVACFLAMAGQSQWALACHLNNIKLIAKICSAQPSPKKICQRGRVGFVEKGSERGRRWIGWGRYLEPAQFFVHQFVAAALVVPIVDTFKSRLLLSALSRSTGDKRRKDERTNGRGGWNARTRGHQPAYNIFITILIVSVDCGIVQAPATHQFNGIFAWSAPKTKINKKKKKKLGTQKIKARGENTGGSRVFWSINEDTGFYDEQRHFVLKVKEELYAHWWRVYGAVKLPLDIKMLHSFWAAKRMSLIAH